MLKNLFRDSILYTLSTVFARGITFFLLPIYTKVLNPSEFGLLDYFVAIGAITSIFITLEITQGLARHIPEYLNNAHKKRQYASTCFWFILFSYSTLLLLVFLFSTPLSLLLLDSPDKGELIRLAAGSYWVGGMLNLLHCQLRGELRAKASALLSLFSALSTVIITVLLIVWLKLGVQGALLAQIIAGGLAFLVSLYIVRSSYAFSFDPLSLQQMLGYSVPLIPSSLAVVFAMYFDRIALKELMSLSDVGIYAVGQKISLVVTLALIGFRSALTPLIYAHHNKSSTPSDLAQIFNVFCLISLSIILCISIFAREIVEIISSEIFREAADVVPLLVFSVLLSNMYIFAPGLDIEKRTGIISLINICVAILSLGLNYLLIPFFGILGAAYATLIAFSIGFVMYMYISQRLYPVPHNWKKAITLLSLTILGIISAHAATHLLGDSMLVKVCFTFISLCAMLWMGDVPFTYVKNTFLGYLKK